jgi:protein required for attachment to host cells
MLQSVPEAREMKPVWIVVANGFQAQLYERAKPRDPLQPLASFVHPESRLKSGELNEDQLGRRRAAVGKNPASYSPQTDPKEKEQERFARQIADYLDQGTREDRHGGLLLFASPQMLGTIREMLDSKTSQRVQHSAAIDLTAWSGRELETRIAQQLGT